VPTLDDAPEVIVVLGGGLLPDGSPTPATLRRGASAADLARVRPHAAVIASGSGAPPSEPARPAEAAHIAALLAECGVAPERIRLEDESMDTVGNAVLTAARYLDGLRPRPLTLVTSPFHLRRAGWAFARALPGWEIRPHAAAAGDDDVPRAANEPAYLRADQELLSGVADGDLRAMFERLERRWPGYRKYASRLR
jgi:uncharacterized SAM-binding protein YcdF (DUF218 family)